MDTVTATQTDEGLLAEALGHFGLTRKDIERHTERVWSVADGLLTIQTAIGPLKYRAGDGDQVPCAVGHTYPRWFGGCRQCKHAEKHSLDPAVSYAAKRWLGKLDTVRRKLRIESARSGAAPGSRKATWGERGASW